LSGRSIW